MAITASKYAIASSFEKLTEAVDAYIADGYQPQCSPVEMGGQFIQLMVVDLDTSIMSTEVTLTPAAILALHTTPAVLLPAPGAGFAIAPLYGQAFLDFNSVAYADGDGVKLYTGSARPGYMVLTTSFMTAAADAHVILHPYGGDSSTLAPNQPMTLAVDFAFTAGNSPVTVKIFYRILALT